MRKGLGPLLLLSILAVAGCGGDDSGGGGSASSGREGGAITLAQTSQPRLPSIRH